MSNHGRRPRPGVYKGEKEKVVLSAAAMRSAAAARYLERRGRSVEADGRRAFDEAAIQRGFEWLRRQHARVSKEVRGNTPLAAFEPIESWVGDGLRSVLELGARIEAARDENERLVTKVRAQRAKLRAAGALVADEEPSTVAEADPANPLLELMISGFSRNEWQSDPPFAIERALAELGRRIVRSDEALVGATLDELTREVETLLRDRGEKLDRAQVVGMAVMARSTWLPKIERPANAPIREDWDGFIDGMERVLGDGLEVADLVDAWAFFAPEDAATLAGGGSEAWRKRLAAYQGRRRAE